jgi:hypothetical protein
MGTPLGDAELLETRVEMVELERTQPAVVAAQPAAAAGLLDKDLLHTTSPPNHRLLTAPEASEVAPGFTEMFGLPVMRALERDVGQPGCAGLTSPWARASADASPGPQAVLVEPVPDGPLAAPNRLSDLGDSRTTFHEGFQLLSCDLTLAGMLRAIGGPQTVLHRPVTDGAFMQAHPPADLGKRPALLQ